jgi:predicted permease
MLMLTNNMLNIWHAGRIWLERLRATLFRSKREHDLESEIEYHLDSLAAGYVKKGLNELDARLAAKRDFGALEPMKETYRDRRGFPLIESMGQDLRFAWRGLRKSPVFALVAVGSLALGIGANTAIFSFVNAILLMHLPVPQAERLVMADSVVNIASLDELLKHNTIFDGLFGRFQTTANLMLKDQPQWISAELVTGQYFSTLRVKPALGRMMTEADVQDAAGNPVCVLSFHIWQERFDGDPSIVGRSILVNGHPYRVIGVSERGFYGTDMQHRIDLEAPATRVGDFMPAFGKGSFDWVKGLSWLFPMGRLKADISRAVAQDRLEAQMRQLHPDSKKKLEFVDGSQGFGYMRNQFGKPILVLMAVVGIVLLAACANLANLLLARSQTRRKEFAVRASIGASRARLIRQSMVESTLLGLCGGAAGLAVGFWIHRTLLLYLNAGKPIGGVQVPFEARMVGFAVLLSLCAAVLFGIVPALQASRIDLVSGFKDDGAGMRHADGLLSRRVLTGLQITLSFIVLFAAGLLTQTLSRLKTVDVGFEPAQLVSLSVDPAANGHSPIETSRIYDELLRRTRLLRGVKAAALTLNPPFASSGMTMSMDIEVPGYTKRSGIDVPPPIRNVGPGYFATLNRKFLEGRDFSERDNAAAPRVAIVNEKFVKHYFAGLDSLHRHFRQGGGDLEIVGVVANTHDYSLKNGLEEIVYWAEKQSTHTALSLVARVQGKPEQFMPSLLAIVHGIDPRLPVSSIGTIDAGIDAGLSTERMLAFLSNLFAGLATLLAGIGLYGVISYSVTRRKREIGIRFAIGARRGDVAKLFLREVLVLIACGIAAGIPLALVSTTFLKSLLFGLSSTDTVSLCASVLALLLAAFLAIALPLRKATRVDPINALRYE